MKYISMISLILLSFIFSCGKKSDPAPTQTFVTGWNEDLKLTIGTQDRYYRVYQPAGLSANTPVVILLHGGTQSMRKIFETTSGGSKEWTKIADSDKFLLIAPNGVNGATNDANSDNQNWNDCRVITSGDGYSGADDVTFISELIEWTKKSFSVDNTRFYVTGSSNGGMMSYRLATELNAKIAAIAAFIALQPDPNDCPAPSAAIPMMICVGTQDPKMPFLGGAVDGGNGSVKSATATRDFWLGVNGLISTDVIDTPLTDINTTDNSTVLKRSFGSSNPNKEIEYYVITGGGHTMPSINNSLPALAEAIVGKQNKDMEGARVAWDFLKRHKK
jgi:polyhydroxybutyrate depolymerase